MNSADGHDAPVLETSDQLLGSITMDGNQQKASYGPSMESETPNGDEQQFSSDERPRGLKRRMDDSTDKPELIDFDKVVTRQKSDVTPSMDQRKMKEPVVTTFEVESEKGRVENGVAIDKEADAEDDVQDEIDPDTDKYKYYGPASTTMDGFNEDANDNNGNVVLPEDNDNPFYALPEGVKVEWNQENTSATVCMTLGMGSQPTPRVCLVGRAEIRILEGSLEVLGYVMTPSSEPTIICSPYWSSWLTLTSLSMPCKAVLTSTTRRRSHPSFRVLSPTRPIIVPPSWVTSVDEMVNVCTPLLSKVSAPNDATMAGTAMFRTSLDDEDVDDGQEDQDLNHGPRLVCMITGSKGVGKSTLLRYMTNRLLSRSSGDNETLTQHHHEYVAILDADVGQPELAPPGLLRLAVVKRPLLHPPYWNLTGNDDERQTASTNNHGSMSFESQFETVSSIFFGAITSKADPTRYINAVQFLMEEYQRKILPNQNIPLLINMDGWVKGMGYQILTSLIQSLKPTHLCQILGETQAQTFQLAVPQQEEQSTTLSTPKIYVLQACTVIPDVSLCSIPSVTWRNFRWATYFLPRVAPRGGSPAGDNHDDFTSAMMTDTLEGWNFVSAKDLQTGWISVSTRRTGDEDDAQDADECRLACALARERPYCVPMEAVDCSLIGSNFQDLVSLRDCNDRILKALNGNIVSLCTSTITNESLGYGILRSIDWSRRLLYVLVPPTVSPESLTRTTALVGGNLPLPLPLLFRGVYAESFPYLTTLDQNKDGQSHAILGAEPMKSRNNIARRGMMNTASSS